MPDEKKIKQLLEIYRSLDDAEKDILVSTMIEDTELLGKLLKALTDSDGVMDSMDTNEALGYSDFLKKIRG